MTTAVEVGEAKVFGEDAEVPYSIRFTVRGVRDFFFNAPNVEEYEKRERAPKGRQRTDPNPEGKVWRNGDGELAVPGNEFIKAMAEAARGLPDPTKSGHKSMRPVIAKAMQAHEELCPFFHQNGSKSVALRTWDEIDRRLARYGNNKMGPQSRPTLKAGWMTAVSIDVTWPEIFAPADVAVLMTRAGNIGIGDAKTIGYGRFVIHDIGSPSEIAWS